MAGLEPFATCSDLEARYRPLLAGEQARASALLGDASDFLRCELARHGRKVDPDDQLQASALRVVCCSMARRAIASATDGDYKQVSVTAGPFTRSTAFANPSGDMYLTSQERQVLGLPKQEAVACSIPARVEGGEHA